MPGPGIPEIKWGIFHDRKGLAHVAPALNNYLMKPHTLSEKCFCGPRIEIDPNVTIIIHEVVH